MAEKIFDYKIKYGKAWRVKQQASKMIYEDWEEGTRSYMHCSI
jgi:hypothetical protein